MPTTNKIKKLYNGCCVDYDKHMRVTGHYTAQRRILKLLIKNIEEPILDLACGSGFLIKLLSKNFKDIVGNDFSDAMTKLAGKKSKTTITCDNAETLKTYKHKFKTIISCNLFFYLQHQDKAIKRWRKILHNNGQIIFIEEHPFVKPKSKEMDNHTKELMSLINPISPAKISKLMTKNGFILTKEVKTKIDNKHDLYGLIFSLKK
ncbi:MAG: methyltransferase type 11 [uncultured bacterium]|nr:MAG: methyltransferase type 11 [uncultured bacterium]